MFDPDVLRANFVPLVCIILHGLVFHFLQGKISQHSLVHGTGMRGVTHFEEALNRLRHVLRQLGAGDWLRGATEIPRRDLSAPRCIARPLNDRHDELSHRREEIWDVAYIDTDGHRRATLLEHRIVATYQARELRCEGVTTRNAAILGMLHTKHDRLLQSHLLDVAATIALGVRAIYLLRDDPLRVNVACG